MVDNMAIKQISKAKKKEEITLCPRCGEEALMIDVEGMFVRWLTCPKCKFKKLVKKEEEIKPIKVVSLKDSQTFV